MSASRVRRPTHRSRRDDGSALIELVGVLPLAVLVGGFIFQLFLVGYGTIEAESQARFAARQASLGTSEAQIGAMLRDRVGFWDPQLLLADGDLDASRLEPGVGATGDADAVSVTVQVTVPFLGFGPRALQIDLTRHAVMPKAD